MDTGKNQEPWAKTLSLFWVFVEWKLSSITFMTYKKPWSFAYFLRYSKPDLCSSLVRFYACNCCFVSFVSCMCFLRGTCLITSTRQTSQYFLLKYWKLWDLAKYFSSLLNLPISSNRFQYQCGCLLQQTLFIFLMDFIFKLVFHLQKNWAYSTKSFYTPPSLGGMPSLPPLPYH